VLTNTAPMFRYIILASKTGKKHSEQWLRRERFKKKKKKKKKKTNKKKKKNKKKKTKKKKKKKDKKAGPVVPHFHWAQPLASSTYNIYCNPDVPSVRVLPTDAAEKVTTFMTVNQLREGFPTIGQSPIWIKWSSISFELHGTQSVPKEKQ